MKDYPMEKKEREVTGEVPACPIEQLLEIERSSGDRQQDEEIE